MALGLVLALAGCASPSDVTEEIIGNLVKAGIPSDDIMVVSGRVYVGRDAEVSLAASRELLATGGTTEEQHRTNNFVSASVTKICINGPAFTGVFSTALDMAIQNYDELPLTFAMARAPSTDCSFIITAVIDPNMNGGVAGFPANGLPFGQVTIGGQLSQYGVDVIEHVITHEIGHTIGFRHSDYYNRAISCGVGGNEGDAGVGAIHIPGTPTTASSGGSLMNSCFRAFETGEFSPSDITSLKSLYTPSPSYSIREFGYNQSWRVEQHPRAVADVNGDGRADIVGFANGGAYVALSTGTGFTGGQYWLPEFGCNQGWRVDLHPRTLADFNGNGRADVIGFGSDGVITHLY
ncbi:M57 family metalloprotease [Corallococcus terminator]|uniref:Protease B n=1 Tax=Corallococcus terminator TaxID=2316733 RepID=A0A3A8ILV2_9BACT|nr:M57 family metalloprotease [Corallococcus terminator]RKG83668.1 hypothetical protein D7V88_23680 [Corallococcus terminator]